VGDTVPSPTFDLFRRAILSQQQIVCTYQGYKREICPHAVGWKNGREQAIGFQFGGDSSKGLPLGGDWRCMALVGVSNASLRPGPWRTGTNHSRPQTCVDQIDTEIPY